MSLIIPSLPLKARLTPAAFQLQARRTFAASSIRRDQVEKKPESLNTPHPETRKPPLSHAQKRFLESALRVNHAGELAATTLARS